MALLKCPECGKEVSDAASSCPHCGRPIRDQKSSKMTIRVLSLLFGALLILLWFGGRIAIFFPYDTAILGIIIVLAALINR